MVGTPSDDAHWALVFLVVDDALGVVDGEVILFLRCGSSDVLSGRLVRFVLSFLLGLELLCFSWDGFSILVGSGFSF